MSLTEMEAPVPTRPIKAYETFSFYTAEGLATLSLWCDFIVKAAVFSQGYLVLWVVFSSSLVDDLQKYLNMFQKLNMSAHVKHLNYNKSLQT